MNERYFHTGVTEMTYDAVWRGSIIEEKLYALGNVFPDREAAEFEIERRKVIAELSDFVEGDDAKWDGKREHWIIGWDTDINALSVQYCVYIKWTGMYFSSKEVALAAVEAVGEDRVKKYYLGVKE